MPYIQTYSATKVYCDFLTEGLNYELKKFGVDVLGIRSFGLKPNHKNEPKSSYRKFFNVTA